MNEALVSHDGPGHLWLASLGQRGMALGLTRIHAILDRLDRPDRQMPCVVVAGSDGKGSTSSMLAALLTEAGLNVGHYTSPHLIETRERVRVGAACVSAATLDGALVAVQQAAQNLAPTPFEALTAAALVAFAEAQIDIAVLEVGLGGRLDAVNATDPIVSVVTHLSLDHTAILGTTLPEIAWEKAAVARNGRALVAAQPGLVADALRKHGLTPELLHAGADLEISPEATDADAWGQRGFLSGRLIAQPRTIAIALAGDHQRENAALALLAYHAVAAWFAGHGRALPPLEAIVDALATSDWPCRAEVIADAPIAVLDAAHNPAGIAAFAALLARHGTRWQIVLAVRKDRVAADLVRALAPVAAGFWLPRMAGETLMDAADLAAVVDAVAPGAHVAVGSAARCLAQAKREALPGCGVAITGSQHALGEWLQAGVIVSPRLSRRLGLDQTAQKH